MAYRILDQNFKSSAMIQKQVSINYNDIGLYLHLIINIYINGIHYNVRVYFYTE